MRTFTLFLALLACLTIQAQALLPASVQNFLDERTEYAHNTSSHYSSQFAPTCIIDDREMIDAFIGIDGPEVITLLQCSGVNVNCVFDGFVTAQIPVDRLKEIWQLKGVNDIEISNRMQLCTDSTLSVTHVNQVLNGLDYNLPQSYDGTGVIVGVIDTGFDFLHRAFRRKDDTSKTRVVRLYHTKNTKGHTARYNDIVRLPGSVFMDDEIYGLTPDTENTAHGTHVASIAAGSHVHGYGGMAPGADIVLCDVSVLDGSMSAVEVANCVYYIDAYADSVGQPCVISLSVSTPNGQRDGNDYLSKVVKQITGPGRIFVISAGNDGGRKAYAHKLTTPTKPLNLLFKYKSSLGDSAYYYAGLLADVWMRKSQNNFYYKFHVLDLNSGEIVWESKQYSSKTVIPADSLNGFFKYYSASDTTGYIEGKTSYASDGRKYRLEISIHNLISTHYTMVNGERRGRYAIGASIYPRKNVENDIDAWICNSGSGFSIYNGPVKTMDGEYVANFYSPATDSCSIGNYAVCDSTISVGAYAARNSYYSMVQDKIITDNSITIGDIASFSSFQIAGAGPTGEALPTVCAPGINVVAAGSRYSYFARNSPQTVLKDSEGFYWGVMSGTSMSAPTVAGIIALWLQANPNLSVAEIKDIIAQTAVKDRFTMAKPNRFGPNGKIDALAGMQLVIKRMGFKLGDVNNDGFIDVADVVLLIDYVLNGSAGEDFIIEMADINHDGNIAVDDVVLLIDMVLGS